MLHYTGRWCRPARVIFTACKTFFLNGYIGTLSTIHPILRFKYCKPEGFGSYGLSRSEQLILCPTLINTTKHLLRVCARDTETITPDFPVSRSSQYDQNRISSVRPDWQCDRPDQQNMCRYCIWPQDQCPLRSLSASRQFRLPSIWPGPQPMLRIWRDRNNRK